MHPAISEELSMLKERFPGKSELSLDDYAEYFGLRRKYAPQHFYNINRGQNKIGHKKVGRKIIIPMLDFAYWLAQHKVVDGTPLQLPGDIKAEMKRRRGFAQTQNNDYRSIG